MVPHRDILVAHPGSMGRCSGSVEDVTYRCLDPDADV